MDAGFTTGENLTEFIELGYEVDTKSANEALVQALRKRVTVETPWTTVGKNAEMVGWTNYQIHACPYPLPVGLERFHTPKGVLHAVLIRNQEDPPASDSICRSGFTITTPARPSRRATRRRKRRSKSNI